MGKGRGRDALGFGESCQGGSNGRLDNGGRHCLHAEEALLIEDINFDTKKSEVFAVSVSQHLLLGYTP